MTKKLTADENALRHLRLKIAIQKFLRSSNGAARYETEIRNIFRWADAKLFTVVIRELVDSGSVVQSCGKLGANMYAAK